MILFTALLNLKKINWFKICPKVEMKKNKEFVPKEYFSAISFLLGLLAILVFLLVGIEVIKSQSSDFKELKKTLGFKELLPTSAPYPVNQEISPLPSFTARSVVALDIDSMVGLYQKNPGERVSPASTTKIMTALVALDYYSLNQVLTVGEFEVEGNMIDLVSGEEITVENLLYGLLVGSGNDAALVLAQNYPGGTTGFLLAMNKKAAQLQLENTRFANPTGLDEEGHFSTALDLARLTVEAIKNPTFSRIVSVPSLVITDVSGQKTHFLENTNELIGKLEGVKGVKTGWTQNAGECLIALTERNGEKIVTVLLGSEDRFGETQALINWVFENFRWQTISPEN